MVIALWLVTDKPLAMKPSDTSKWRVTFPCHQHLPTHSKSLITFGTWAELIQWQLGEGILANSDQMEGDGLLRNLIAVKAELSLCGRLSVCKVLLEECLLPWTYLELHYYIPHSWGYSARILARFILDHQNNAFAFLGSANVTVCRLRITSGVLEWI